MPRIEIGSVSHPSVFTEVKGKDEGHGPEITLVVHRLDNIGLMEHGLFLEFAHEHFGDPTGSDDLATYADQLFAPHPKSGKYVEVVPSYERGSGTWLLVLDTVHGDRLYEWDLAGYGWGELTEPGQ